MLIKLLSRSISKSVSKSMSKLDVLIALKKGDVNLLEKAILNGVSANESIIGYNLTPLKFALHNKMPEIVEILLKLGADPNKIDHDLCFPLYYALMQHDDTKCIDLLLKHGALLNDNSFGGWAVDPIMGIFMRGNDIASLSIMKFLIKKGLDINKTISIPLHPELNGRNLIYHAIISHNTKIIELLLNLRVDVSNFSNNFSLNNKMSIVEFTKYKDCGQRIINLAYWLENRKKYIILLLCANKYSTKSMLHADVFPKDMIRHLISFL